MCPTLRTAYMYCIAVSRRSHIHLGTQFISMEEEKKKSFFVSFSSIRLRRALFDGDDDDEDDDDVDELSRAIDMHEERPICIFRTCISNAIDARQINCVRSYGIWYIWEIATRYICFSLIFSSSSCRFSTSICGRARVCVSLCPCLCLCLSLTNEIHADECGCRDDKVSGGSVMVMPLFFSDCEWRTSNCVVRAMLLFLSAKENAQVPHTTRDSYYYYNIDVTHTHKHSHSHSCVHAKIRSSINDKKKSENSKHSINSAEKSDKQKRYVYNGQKTHM